MPDPYQSPGTQFPLIAAREREAERRRISGDELSAQIASSAGRAALTRRSPQSWTAIEREAGAGIITSEAAIEGADRFIETATAMQRLVLRIGIASVPVIAIGAAFIIIKRKYSIDEKKYDELVKEIESRKTAK